MALVTKSFSDIITFTRTSGATYFDSNGVLQTAGNNVPRLDYNPATLAAQGLLIEESRTNLMLQSQFVSGWTATAGTLTANVVASPNGTTDAASYIEDSTTAVRNVNQSSQSFTAGATLTASMFVKQTGGATRHFRIQVGSNTGTNGFRAYFNLSTNSVALQTVGFGTGTAVANSATITPIGNGWYRISASGTVDPAATTAAGMGFMQDTPTGSANYTGDGTSGLFIWGAQLEAGAFPTSYIPTTTTALTRSADVASVNTLSPWFNATEGTLFAQASLISSSYSQGVLVDLGAGGAFGTTEYLNWSGTGWVLNPNTPPINVTSSVTTTSTAKVAAGMKVNDSVISANGLIGVTDTSCGIVSAPTTLSIGKAGWALGNYFNGWIQRIIYYPRRLSNAELQALTV